MPFFVFYNYSIYSYRPSQDCVCERVHVTAAMKSPMLVSTVMGNAGVLQIIHTTPHHTTYFMRSHEASIDFFTFSWLLPFLLTSLDRSDRLVKEIWLAVVIESWTVSLLREILQVAYLFLQSSSPVLIQAAVNWTEHHFKMWSFPWMTSVQNNAWLFTVNAFCLEESY